MEGYSGNDDDEIQNHPQLLDLITKHREWTEKREAKHVITCCEDQKLELRLGPPGVEKERDESLGYNTGIINNNNNGHKFSSSGFPGNKQQMQPCCTKRVVELQSGEKKTFTPDSANTAVPNPNTCHKRSATAATAPAPVVGWPPIRSFRKNHHANSTSSSSKLPLPNDSQNVVAPFEKKQVEESRPKAGLFVKINMDGVPIGRKVDLKTYDTYHKLCSAVDQLFRGLLSAQMNLSSSAGGIKNNGEGEKAILTDGNGEYTLVYEDNEGDKMLVGDVPWHMFVSTVKRLRVLKSSELSKLFVGSKQEKNQVDV